MQRRDFITLVGSAATAWSFAARAQQSERKRLIAVLMGFSERAGQPLVATFRGSLNKLGWTEGSNLQIELRWGAGDAEKIGMFAKELVDLHPDAILGQTTPVAIALARATKTIPIVFVTVSDPIGSGLAVKSRTSGWQQHRVHIRRIRNGR